MTTKKTSSGAKVGKTFLGKLKKNCTRCTPQTIKVYIRNIKRMHALISDEEGIPETGGWLNSTKLFEKFKKLPLNQRRPLSVAAVKAGKTYKTNLQKWETLMYKAQSEYNSQRNKNLKSETEKKKWPKGGFTSIKKAALEQKRRLRHILKSEPTLKGMYKYQFFIVLKLFTELPFRNTFADLEVEKGTGNYLDIPKKGSIKIILTKYKNVKQLGPKEFTLNRSNTTQLRKFLKYREGLVDHKFLLSTKNGKRMTKSAMGKGLHKVTMDLLGKSFGSRIIRVLAATESKADIDKITDLSNKMLHTTAQTKQYTRK
jgi:hypothetical protein